MAVTNTTFFGSGVIIEAVVSIEDHFGIEFPDLLAFRIERVLDLATAVQELREQDVRQPRKGNGSAKEGSHAS